MFFVQIWRPRRARRACRVSGLYRWADVGIVFVDGEVDACLADVALRFVDVDFAIEITLAAEKLR